MRDTTMGTCSFSSCTNPSPNNLIHNYASVVNLTWIKASAISYLRLTYTIYTYLIDPVDFARYSKVRYIDVYLSFSFLWW